MTEVLPLKMLAAGQAGQVSQVLGDAETVRRLAELGMRAGERVEMLQHGSPCIVRLGNNRMSSGRLCFREGDALNVLVELERAG